jgi:hypothetical protein
MPSITYLLLLLLAVGIGEAPVIVSSCHADWWPSPAMPCMETTELKGDLGIDPCPKLSCVTDTGFEVIDDPWARFVPV